MERIAAVARAMVGYFAGDVRRINHFVKVYGFAKTIGELEELDAQTQYTLEIAALTHDIGIKVSEQKYGSTAGHYQQLEGPAEARALLAPLGIPMHTVERVCWLIARHHTYEGISGADYRILVEADFLVNIADDGMEESAIRTVKERVFRTAAGIALLLDLYRV
jgi:hypothetical protein